MPAPAAPQVIALGSPRAIAAYAGRTVLLASVLPMAVFYLTLTLAGLGVAVGVTLCWYYAGLLLRVCRGRPLMGAVCLGAGLMTVRAVVTFWTGSAFVYFLQPVAGTVATATAFAVTALAGRPVLERLMHDFVPLPGPLAERLRASRFFGYTSLIWSVVYLVNAAGTVWLLTNASLGGFLVLKTVLSPVLTGSAVLASYLLFRLLMRREGVRVRWGTGAVAGFGRSRPA